MRERLFRLFTVYHLVPFESTTCSSCSVVFWVLNLNLRKKKPRVNSLPKSIHPSHTGPGLRERSLFAENCPSSACSAEWLPALPRSRETGLTAPVLAAPVLLFLSFGSEESITQWMQRRRRPGSPVLGTMTPHTDQHRTKCPCSSKGVTMCDMAGAQ